MNFARGRQTELRVPTSLSIADESLISLVPSTRQNFSASSVSTRLHWGQRFTIIQTH